MLPKTLFIRKTSQQGSAVPAGETADCGEENMEKETMSRQLSKLLHMQNQSPALSPNLKNTLNNNSRGKALSGKKVTALIKEQSKQELKRRRTSPRTNRILALQSSKKIEIEKKSN